MTRCHFARAAQAGGRRSEPLPPAHQLSGPLAAESHPVHPGLGGLAQGLQCTAGWGPFRDARPGPQSLAMAARSPRLAGRLLLAGLQASGFSGHGLWFPSPTGLSIPVSGSPGPWPPVAPLRPENPPRAWLPRAWLPGVGSAPGPGFGQAWQRVHVRAWVYVGAGARGGRGCHRVRARAAYSSAGARGPIPGARRRAAPSLIPERPVIGRRSPLCKRAEGMEFLRPALQ